MLYSVSQKLIQRQMINYGDVLKWLRLLLHCRNAYLEKNRESLALAAGAANLTICRRAFVKLEARALVCSLHLLVQ